MVVALDQFRDDPLAVVLGPEHHPAPAPGSAGAARVGPGGGDQRVAAAPLGPALGERLVGRWPLVRLLGLTTRPAQPAHSGQPALSGRLGQSRLVQQVGQQLLEELFRQAVDHGQGRDGQHVAPGGAGVEPLDDLAARRVPQHVQCGVRLLGQLFRERDHPARRQLRHPGGQQVTVQAGGQRRVAEDRAEQPHPVGWPPVHHQVLEVSAFHRRRRGGDHQVRVGLGELGDQPLGVEALQRQGILAHHPVVHQVPLVVPEPAADQPGVGVGRHQAADRLRVRRDPVQQGQRRGPLTAAVRADQHHNAVLAQHGLGPGELRRRHPVAQRLGDLGAADPPGHPADRRHPGHPEVGAERVHVTVEVVGELAVRRRFGARVHCGLGGGWVRLGVALRLRRGQDGLVRVLTGPGHPGSPQAGAAGRSWRRAR